MFKQGDGECEKGWQNKWPYIPIKREFMIGARNGGGGGGGGGGSREDEQCTLRNFVGCKIPQVAKIRNLEIFQAQKPAFQPTATPATQKNKNCEKLNLQKRKFC